ncbi:hypothetical protein Tco_0740134 [Tanacetum coccineum]
MSVKYPTYVNITSSSEEQPNERTPSPPPRKKSLSPPQAPSKSISSKSTHYTSSSSPSESPKPTHVSPPPKLRFVIKQEPQDLPPLQMLPNDPYVSKMDNWPSGPSNLSPPPRVSRPPPGFLNPPPGFEPLPSTQPLFVNINNNTPHVHNNVPLLEHTHHPPPNLGNQDFPNPPNILDFVHPNDMPHLHNMFCQLIIEERVKVNQKAHILEHKQRVQESLLILTTYTPYHSRIIRCIQDFDELKDRFLTLKNTLYPHQRYVVYNTLVNEEEQAGFTQYAISIKKIRHIRAITLSKTSMTRRPQYSVSEDFNTPYPKTSIFYIGQYSVSKTSMRHIEGS